ncbi:MAG TPA: hypothetical protein VK200_08615 [Candidatus Limnocylindrales bacterium]|nr:hypothetical protein [Candidatus Limnocylindrales bacterium]
MKQETFPKVQNDERIAISVIHLPSRTDPVYDCSLNEELWVSARRASVHPTCNDGRVIDLLNVGIGPLGTETIKVADMAIAFGAGSSRSKVLAKSSK